MDERLNKLYSAYALALESQSHEKNGDYAHPVFGEGQIGAPLMFLGEAPGAEEAKLSRPFVGKAGKQLDEMLLEAGIEREKVFVTNTVKYRPTNIKEKSVSNRTPTQKEVACSLELLKEEIAIVRPEILATLGNTPLNAILKLSTNRKCSVGEVHGQAVEIRIGECALLLIALYHPASMIYNPALKTTLQTDLIQLGKILKQRTMTI